MELDTSSIEKRFAFGFLQQLLRWMDISQEFIAHLGREIPSPLPPSLRKPAPPSARKAMLEFLPSLLTW